MDEVAMKDLRVLRAPPGFDMIDTQRKLQERVRGEHPDWPVLDHSADGMAELSKIVKENVLAIVMEAAEILDRLDWKYWKPGQELTAEEFETLVVETLYEAIDLQHFLNNIYIALGANGERVGDIYYTKNVENHARQDRWFGRPTVASVERCPRHDDENSSLSVTRDAETNEIVSAYCHSCGATQTDLVANDGTLAVDGDGWPG